MERGKKQAEASHEIQTAEGLKEAGREKNEDKHGHKRSREGQDAADEEEVGARQGDGKSHGAVWQRNFEGVGYFYCGWYAKKYRY
eukprot:766854-Hanusia_phi.AAC.5